MREDLLKILQFNISRTTKYLCPLHLVKRVNILYHNRQWLLPRDEEPGSVPSLPVPHAYFE